MPACNFDGACLSLFHITNKCGYLYSAVCFWWRYKPTNQWGCLDVDHTRGIVVTHVGIKYHWGRRFYTWREKQSVIPSTTSLERIKGICRLVWNQFFSSRTRKTSNKNGLRLLPWSLCRRQYECLYVESRYWKIFIFNIQCVSVYMYVCLCACVSPQKHQHLKLSLQATLL